MKVKEKNKCWQRCGAMRNPVYCGWESEMVQPLWRPVWRSLQHFPDSSLSKESASNARDPGLIPGSGRSAGEGISYPIQYSWASLVAQLVKNQPAMRETWVGKIPWRRERQPTLVFWLENSMDCIVPRVRVTKSLTERLSLSNDYSRTTRSSTPNMGETLKWNRSSVSRYIWTPCSQWLKHGRRPTVPQHLTGSAKRGPSTQRHIISHERSEPWPHMLENKCVIPLRSRGAPRRRVTDRGVRGVWALPGDRISASQEEAWRGRQRCAQTQSTKLCAETRRACYTADVRISLKNKCWSHTHIHTHTHKIPQNKNPMAKPDKTVSTNTTSAC